LKVAHVLEVGVQVRRALIAAANQGLIHRDLKLLPWWDPLRGDPCFEKIVASLAPKSE
jgi:hypothetical protein